MTSVSDRGISLLELIVACAVVSILLLATFSISKNVKARASGVQCINNLRSVYTGLNSYAADNDGFFPANRDTDLRENPLETLSDELIPGMIDLPSILNVYIPEKTFLCPENKKSRNQGYYLNEIGSSYRYLYSGINPSLSANSELSLSPNKIRLVSEIYSYHDGKGYCLFGDGHITSGMP